MADKRLEAIKKFIIESIGEIVPTSDNTKIYTEKLSAMDDTSFISYLKDLVENDRVLPFYLANYSENKVDIKRVIKLLRKHGTEPFQRIWMEDPDTGVMSLSPNKYPIMYWPLRLQQQRLFKKISVPRDNSHIDDLTGQATTESKGAAISYPELQILYTMGLNKTIHECIQARGGDVEAFREYNNQLIENGAVNIESITSTGTKVKSTKTVSAIFKAMHLANQL